MTRVTDQLIRLALCLALPALLALAAGAQQGGAASPFTLGEIEKVWKFAPQPLALLKTAFQQRADSERYALHMTGMPGVAANVINELWSCRWQGRKLLASCSSLYVCASRGDASIGVNSLSFDIIDENGMEMLSWTMLVHAGREQYCLCQPNGQGMSVDVVDVRGKKTHKIFAHLDAPFSDPIAVLQLDKLKSGQHMSWTEFDPEDQQLDTDTLVVSKLNDKPDPAFPWVAQIDTTCSSGEHDTQFLNAQHEPVRLSMGALDFTACPPAVATLRNDMRPWSDRCRWTRRWIAGCRAARRSPA